MINFLQYILHEVKDRRLQKSDALDLIRQFKTRIVPDRRSFLHPLLHQNSSDFASQRYSSTFTGQEFFLADHVVQEQRVLPGVVFLEIARAAGALAAGQPVIRLRNVVWARPIIVGEQPIHVHIELFPEEDEQGADGEIAFEIYTEPTPQPAQDADVEPVVHSQGRIGLSVLAEAPELDLPGLQARCSQNLLSPSQIYEAFQTIGIDYGPAHQGIEEIHVGAGQILAKLSLPASVSGTHDQFVLHPSLMDSALQALVGFMLGTKDLKPALPFALQEVKIYSGCRPAMWVWLRYAEGSASGDKVQKFDLDLCAESGLVCVQIKSVSLRELESDAGQKGEMETLLLQPDWKEQPVSVDAAPPDYAQHLVILCEPGDMSQEFLERHIEGVRILHLSAEQTGIEERFETCALKVFEEIQRILTTKPRNKILIQLVVVMEGEHQLFCALSGLLKTAQLENPTLIGQQIGVEKWENAPGLLEKLRENSRTPGDTEIRYQDGQRYVAGWKEVEVSQEDVSLPWKDQGIYLITGGAGGLGQIFAKEIAQQVNEATLILTGRSALNANRQAQLQELQASGARVVYEQVDVTDQKAVDSLIQRISKEFGGLNGIIHSAGVVRDNFILKKSREELHDVLPPKVAGVIHLDHASKESDLDFFALFSSVAGGLGNPGQADYATANAFLDAYAGYRNALVASGQRRGHTLSINWPLWKEGGMHVDEATEKMLLQNTGMIAMQTHTGIRAFYHSIASGQAQVMVLEGDLQRIQQTLFAATAISAAPKAVDAPATPDSAIESERVRDQVKGTLIRGISELLHVKPEDIDDEAELADYGCDPITLSELTVRLNQEYALDVASTVFFEHPTLRSVAAYLVAEYPDVFVQRSHPASPKKPALQAEERRAVPVPVPSGTEGITDDVLREKATPYFTTLLSTVIKLPAHRIDADAPMEQYGIDSIMVMDLTAHLEQVFGSLPKTLFFEYQTIRELSGYFLESYHDQLIELLGLGEQAAPQPAKDAAPVTIAAKPPTMRRRPRFASVRSASREKHETGALDIAIIGLSGRYPQAGTMQEFWANLRDGKDCITEIPQDRWDHSLYFDAEKHAPGKTSGKWGGFLDDVDRFDPLFFNISPRDAERMDPQERLFLECAFATLEDAGYTRTTLVPDMGSGLTGDVGVFVGVMYEEYQLYGAQETLHGRPTALSGNAASIANRVSYFCNFHGPSIALDTMCSSSLTTIHLACHSIRRGECTVALAGGVNVSIHPNKYLLLGQNNFLSSKGRCESFGQGGDGYVPGEGVGAVLLKPLSQAIADGDHIYGIIKGTALNHGGKTHGYTVPNLTAQAGVIGQALQSTGIDPRTISYLEAHGTGTSLGDPIEIAGLAKAFQKYTQDTQFCAIGSAKSNIGHCESAAGIGGVTKVLLQLQHRQLAPSLHSKVLNPHIDFSTTPFVVQQELTEWIPPVINGRKVPRRAGISSFGAGGSNAHVIIEEYAPDDRERPRIEVCDQHPAIILLSARHEAQLREQAQRLLTAIRTQRYADADLADLAYTLQVGREALDERLSVIVRSVRELEEKLTGFLDGQKEVEELYRGRLKDNKEMLAVFAADEDMANTIDAWIAKGKYAKLAELWAKGIGVDWNAIYDDLKPHRISLPTYPFLRERYWGAERETIFMGSPTTQRAISAWMHPFLHQNTSDLLEQRFSSTFTGQEFFLKDHVVKGQRVLPGVAYLEMARAAVEQAAGALAEDRQGIQLNNVVWARPIIVEDTPVQIHISLFAEDTGEITYEIYSDPTLPSSQADKALTGNIDAEPLVYCQGRAMLRSVTEVPPLDLPALQAECSQGTLSSGQLYDMFRTMGIVYGPGHRGIEAVYVGSGQVLAKLSLPSSVSETLEQFVLHPSLMDAALQASIGLLIGSGDLKTALPFALQELEILGPCTSPLWARVRSSVGSAVGDPVQKLDIDVCDGRGTICVRMKGFSSRVLEGEIGTVLSPSTLLRIDSVEGLVDFPATVGTLMLQPDWKEQEIAQEASVPDYTQHLVILCEPDEVSLKNIESHIGGVRVLTLQADQTVREPVSIKKRFETYVLQVFEKIQRILQAKPQGKVLIQIVVAREGEQQVFSGLVGLLKTAQLENPTIIGQLIGVEQWENAPSLLEKLQENSRTPDDTEIRYQDGQRYVAGWKEVEVSQKDVSFPWKDRGIYLITGGAGGLGQIFAKEIAQQVKEATLILTGRSTLNENRQAQLQELEAFGVRVAYEQVDVTDQKSLNSFIQRIAKEFGGLNGIIHSAGVIRDNFILKKSKEELQEVLAPKVRGVVNLDHASKDLGLDFFVLFSSVAGGLGNPGQADYATGNAFLDAYARYRNELVASKHRQGHTLSINWPLWKEGGMHIDEATEKMLMQNMGLIAMQTQTGIRAFYHSLVSGQAQMMVMEGKLAHMKHTVFSMTTPPSPNAETALTASDSTPEIDPATVLDYVKQTLIRGISELLNVKPEDIDDDGSLDEYGSDPITLTELTRKLNQDYSLDLASNVFFEHLTLRSMAEYLVAEYQDVFVQRLRPEASNPPSRRAEESKAVPESVLSPSTPLRIDSAEVLRIDSVEGIAGDVLQEKATQYLTKLFSVVIKLPAHRIEADASLEKYGIDSIMMMDLTNQLEQVFGSLSKTLFFEYQNIRELTGYFLDAYRDRLIDVLGLGEKAAPPPQPAKDAALVATAVKPAIRRRPRFASLRSASREEQGTGALDIAIIGLSGRYPQASTIQEFWANLHDGKDCITEIPKDRWDHSLYFDAAKNTPGKTYSKWGGFLDGVDRFDSLFFNISPRDTERMDPQERLFLECAFATLEDAGYTRNTLIPDQGSRLAGDVGVFVGVMYEEYQLYGAQETLRGRPTTLSGNPASIANRVSYFCNFHGPSIAVDTMCSSSLTTIHLACHSIRRGECQVALAGGVNVSIHPNKYLLLGQSNFLSSKGRCESFGQGGDGYVPGEGVGAVLLKPVSQAIADGDHIYGVIKGTALNHGGKTTGYTVPNPTAQAHVIGHTLQSAGIDPRTISYLEAHGTGTSLGDPIEIAGLVKAFQEYTQDTQFCAIGSAKSNIGHCESAAGIGGVTKILLQLQHGQLVPSLHSKVLNPHIDFSATPFVVQRELADWTRPVIDGLEIPRRAGISAFGAGGSNAHVIIEEYRVDERERERIEVTAQQPAIILLSAKHEAQLREQSQRLLDAIRDQRYTDSDLADMAYTFQVGREAMDERLTVIVRSVRELEEKLTGFLDGQKEVEELYRGRLKDNKEMLAVFATDDDMANTIDAWVAKGKYAKLAELWAKGIVVDWNTLYNDLKPRRISLPTYPFARECYWIPEISDQLSVISNQGVGVLHPLLHQNTSDLSEQRFSSTFTGQEFFLADHVVQGQRVLPGVACLEMARAAVDRAVGAFKEAQTGIRLKNIVWARPVTVREQPVQVHIGIFPEETKQWSDGGIAFEIYSEPEQADAESVVYSQGKAELDIFSLVQPLDLPVLQTECSQSTMNSGQLYDTFRALGIDYGPGQRGVEAVYVGADQVLAKLSLPASVADTQDQFVLHPSLMDSALQASIALMMDSANSRPLLPFALQELEIYGACTPIMWVLLRYSDGSKAGDRVQKVDIDVCDESGAICVRMKGFSSRVLEGETGSISFPAPLGTLMLQPDWKEQDIAPEAPVPDYAQHVVILCESGEDSLQHIESHIDGVRVLPLQSEQTDSDPTGITKRFETYTLHVFEEIQRILKAKPKGKVLIQIVVSMEKEQQLFSGLSGLLKTAHLENPHMIGQLIGVDSGEETEGLIEKLLENSRSPGDQEIRYQDGTRYVAGWKQLTPRPPLLQREGEQNLPSPSRRGAGGEVVRRAALPWKDQGIYLITGGAGGLGHIFAKEIAQQVNEATLILTGRSALNANRQAQLQELQASGARVVYEQVDVTDQQAVDSLIQHISKEFGGLNGIIHSAGVLRDNFILKKSREELYDVLPPKVAGTIYLDHASKESDLDFFVLFSSVAGGLGNPGQADYATANAFLDAYAGYRNALVASGQRRGHTLSINWPLWKEGGMHIDEATEKMLLQNTGMIAMQTHTGIRAFYHSIASGQDQVMVMEGDLQRIRQTLFAATAISTAPKADDAPAAPDSAIESERVREQVKGTLIRGISELLHVNPEDIDDEAELADYGCDPITLNELTGRLNQEYALDLASTVFFEHPTIRSAAAYLVATYQDVFVQRFQTQVSKTPSSIEEIVPTPVLNKVAEIADDVLQEKATPYFTKLLSTVMKLPAHRIDADAPLEQYGIDSIMVMDLTAHLEQIFGSLPKTLFFEYQTIRELSGYFLESYHDQLIELLGLGEQAVPQPATNAVTVTMAVKPAGRRRPRFSAVRSASREEHGTGALDIAIIGLAGRYPQARTIQEFWQNLCAGKDCITEIPQDRWDHSLYFDEKKDTPGKTYSKWGGFLDGVDQFDPLFFNISPREAELMDPQERVFLECAYATLEDAGYTRGDLVSRQRGRVEGDVGVFAGVMFEEYQLYGAQSTILGNPLALPGNSSSIANRVSYWCNFHGPSLALNTMCSSSLTTIHLACQSLQAGDCQVAIAGGVNLSLHPNKYLLLGQGKFLSSKGRCESFGQGGEGYVPGEGVGAVLLKPLSHAIADGDHIYGVIKGTALNHGGKTNGYTVPNPNAQFSVISRALEVAGIDARTISYLEAHGTGTSLGDPIEITGLTKAFRKYTQDAQFCAIGSAKSNIGHCESAAGISGVTKVLLQLTHRQLVPSLHSKVLNPNIDFSATPFVVQQELAEWPRPVIDGREVPRRAGISSFGAGGSNCHVIIEEYLSEDRERPRIEVTIQKPAMIVLSARNKERLREQGQRLLTALRAQQYSDCDLADLAYTLQVGREAMDNRLSVIVRSVRELEEKLLRFLDGEEGVEDLYRGQVKDNKEMLAVFTADEDLVLTLDAWIAKGKYAKLAELWVKGLAFDWNALYGDIKPHRISLPTYPFAKTSYWAANIEPIEPVEPVEKVVKETPVTMYYHGIWEEAEASASDHSITGDILLFDTSENLSYTIQEGLKAKTILVRPGDQYKRITDEHYIINPEEPDDYKRLTDDLQQGAGIPDKIIHLWSQNQFDGMEEGLTSYLNRGIYSICYLTQALMEQKKRNVHLLSMYEAPGKTIQPHQGGLSGLFRTIKREKPNYMYKAIAMPDLKNILEIIVTEFQNFDSPEIRYENNTRYIREWVIREDIAIEEQISLRENGVYLITGGAGDLGLIFAEYIASQVKARLVLTGRSALNQEKLARIETIKNRGCEVIYMRSDVSNRDDVKKMIQEITARYTTIHGIIHSAGVIRDAYLLKKTREEMQEVIATKVYGTVYLDEETRAHPLDFFALFSSVAGVFGNPGQSDYAYANRFQDYYAEKRTAEGHRGKTVSISWPLWKDGGLRIPKEQEEHFKAKTGIEPMPTELGTEAWRQATFGLNFSHCIVVYGYQHKVEQSIRDLYEDQRVELVESHDEQGIESDERENASIQAKLEGDIKKIASDILKLPLTEIDIKENLGLYGFDSISYSEYAQTISATYNIEITPVVFYESSTIHELSGYIQQEFAPQIHAYYLKTEKRSGTPAPQRPSRTQKESVVRESGVSKEFVVPKEPVVEDIAIIGVHGIFPGSRDLKEFWRNLESETDLITEVPQERWDWRKYYGDPAKEKNKTNSKWGGFIPDVDKFDPAFFNISSDEAEMMDPQQRLFMEVVWKVIEDAGYKASDLWGASAGVFVGVEFNDYQQLISTHIQAANKYMGTGNAHTMIANRISFLLNLRGPSGAIDTACSSSLLAIHQAVKSLRSGESELAIAGGVSLMFTPKVTIGINQLGILSPDGRCKTFDKSANGYVRGEGIGAVLLKPLSKAIADNDNIQAVIKATTANHGGRASSLVSPNSEAQTALLIKAYEEANITPETVTYIETHGTGTALGDPVEIEGIKKAFKELERKQGRKITKTNYCGLGSVKTNIGHLEPAAGIAGMIKVLLSMKHKKLPGTLHLKKMNPYIRLKKTPFYIVEKTQEWERLQDEAGNSIPRRAGVSSFGFGGANAHIVLEEYEHPALPLETDSEEEHIILLSAKNEERLKEYANEMVDWLTNGTIAYSLKDIAYTLQIGRDAMDERLAVVVTSRAELQEKLTRYVEGETVIKNLYQGNAKEQGDKYALLVDGEAGETLIRSYIHKKESAKLAQIWVSAVEIDWALLYEKQHPRRISLPTYPFARERYWIRVPEKDDRSTGIEFKKDFTRRDDLSETGLLDRQEESVLLRKAELTSLSEEQRRESSKRLSTGIEPKKDSKKRNDHAEMEPAGLLRAEVFTSLSEEQRRESSKKLAGSAIAKASDNRRKK